MYAPSHFRTTRSSNCTTGVTLGSQESKILLGPRPALKMTKAQLPTARDRIALLAALAPVRGACLSWGHARWSTRLGPNF